MTPIPSRPQLYLHRLSPITDPQSLRGQLVVVIDLLRATTTMNYALAAGVKQIVPVIEVEEARHMAENFLRSSVILCGERRCIPIPGFDCGNSPSDYTPEKVAGKTMLFSTTNGTRAIYRAAKARRILCGALVNLHAVVETIQQDTTRQHVAPCVTRVPEVHLLCAGSADQFSLDDWWCAGAIADTLQQTTGEAFEESTETTAARQAWRQIWKDAHRSTTDDSTTDPPPDATVVTERLIAQFQTTLAGQKLTAAGLQNDLRDVVAMDRFRSVPEVDRSSTPWTIR